MQLFLFKTNEAVYKGVLDHYHCRLKVVQNCEFYASMETSLSDVLYYGNQLSDN